MRDFHHREKQSSAEKSRGDFENRGTEGQRGILTQRRRDGEMGRKRDRVMYHKLQLVGCPRFISRHRKKIKQRDRGTERDFNTEAQRRGDGEKERKGLYHKLQLVGCPRFISRHRKKIKQRDRGTERDFNTEAQRRGDGEKERKGLYHKLQLVGFPRFPGSSRRSAASPWGGSSRGTGKR